MPHHSSRKYGGKLKYPDADPDKLMDAFSSRKHNIPDEELGNPSSDRRCKHLQSQLNNADLSDADRRTITARLKRCQLRNKMTMGDIAKRFMEATRDIVELAKNGTDVQKAHARAIMMDRLERMGEHELEQDEKKQLRNRVKDAAAERLTHDEEFTKRRTQRHEDHQAAKAEEATAMAEWYKDNKRLTRQAPADADAADVGRRRERPSRRQRRSRSRDKSRSRESQ